MGDGGGGGVQMVPFWDIKVKGNILSQIRYLPSNRTGWGRGGGTNGTFGA